MKTITLRVHFIQAAMIIIGILMVVDRTLRVSHQMPISEVLFNVLEVGGGVALFMLAFEIEELVSKD